MKDGVVLLGRRRGALRAAKRLGLRALVVTDGPPQDDPDARRWARPFRDAEALRGLAPALASSARVRAVLATTEGSVVPAARLRAHLGVAGMDESTALRCTDKARMKARVRRAGVSCTDFVADAGATREELLDLLGLPLVIKARASSGSRGMRVATRAEDVPETLDDGWMAEAYVQGVEMSIESVIAGGMPVFENATEYLAPGWANLLPARLDEATLAAVRETSRTSIRALGIERGLTHLEVFVDRGRVVFGELAARPPGGHIMELIERAYGFDPWEALLRVACGEEPEVRSEAVRTAAVWLVHPGPGTITRVEGVEAARAAPGVVDLPLRAGIGDVVGPRTGIGQELGHVTVTGKDREETAARIRAAHAMIRVEVE